LLLADVLLSDDEYPLTYTLSSSDSEDEDDYEDIYVPPKAEDDCEAESSDEDMDSHEDNDDAASFVKENPFEPVYPAGAGLLLFTEGEGDDEGDEKDAAPVERAEEKKEAAGMVMEAISLDNILPPGKRQRRSASASND